MTLKTLEKAFRAHPWTVFRRYLRLSDEQKRIVVTKFARHRKACKNNEMDIDPRFLPECIEDVKRGVEV